MENKEKVVTLMEAYFKARNEADIPVMWSLIYDPYGNKHDEFFEKMQKEFDDMKKYGLKSTYRLVNVGDPVRKEGYDVDPRWKGCHFVSVEFVVAGRQKKEDLVVMIKDDKAYLNYAKRI